MKWGAWAAIMTLVFCAVHAMMPPQPTYTEACTRFDPTNVAIGATFEVDHGTCGGKCRANPYADNTALLSEGVFNSVVSPPPDCKIVFTYNAVNKSRTVIGPGWSVGACCVTRTG